MMGETQNMLKDDVVVCRCEGTTVREVRAAIKCGAHTVNSLKQQTRVCMGSCRGQNCTDMVRGLIAAETGQCLADILPGTFRPPVRPVRLSTLAEPDEDQPV
jgi:NAD(P)H-nitrite reductase large subunit